MSSTPARNTVCIIGGGFGGINTALRIDKRDGVNTDIYLIDPKDTFVFSPLLYELSVGTAVGTEVTPRYEDLLSGSQVTHVRASITNLDLEERVCHYQRADGECGVLRFDAAVLAVGIKSRAGLIPGAADYSIPFYTVSDAARLTERLELLASRPVGELIRIAVLGAGASGAEVATNIADKLGAGRVDITVVDRNAQIMHMSTTFNRKRAER
jgi:NADH:ubiquinone reductase (non-electrogenic)